LAHPRSIEESQAGTCRCQAEEARDASPHRLDRHSVGGPGNQHALVASTDAAGLVIPHGARQLIALHAQRSDVVGHLEKLVEAHPLFPVLTSMPGVAVRTAAIVIARIPGKTLPIAAALASYAGLAPTTRQPGISIKSERVSRAGNKRLKRALFLSAFASIRFDPVSRAHYDRKRAQGKRHNQALIALAHRRLTVLFAMIRDGSR